MLTDSELDDVSDDDVPETISFQQSKLSTARVKNNLAKRQRDLQTDRKLKNMQREELFTQQKKAKLARLAAARLPDDVIDALPEDEGSDEEAAPEEAAPVHATRTQFSSDDEPDDEDSGINSTVTSKISVKEVQAIKSKAFSSALAFKAVKDAGGNPSIRRQSAKDRQRIKEKKRAR